MDNSNAIRVMRALSSNQNTSFPRMYFKQELLQLVLERIPKEKLSDIHYNNELQKEVEALIAFGLMHYRDIPKEVENG